MTRSVITIAELLYDTGARTVWFIFGRGYLNEVAFVEAEGGGLYAPVRPDRAVGQMEPFLTI